MRVITVIVCGVIMRGAEALDDARHDEQLDAAGRPHQSEASVKTTSPIRYTFLGPNRSPRRPVMSSGTANASRYALVTQMTPLMSASRPR